MLFATRKSNEVKNVNSFMSFTITWKKCLLVMFMTVFISGVKFKIGKKMEETKKKLARLRIKQ